MVYHLCRSAAPDAQGMLPQILSADPLPPAGIASARRTPHSFLVLSPVGVTVLAAAHRDQHRTAGVAALGSLFVGHLSHASFRNAKTAEGFPCGGSCLYLTILL